MNKVQHLHHYLTRTGLISEEALQIWTQQGACHSRPTVDGRKDLVFRDKYQINVLIENFPAAALNIHKLKFAILWWLNLYQNDRSLDEPAMLWEADIKNTTTADVWIGIQVDERVFLKDGVVTDNIYPILLENPDIEMPAWIHDIRGDETWELGQPNDPA